MMKWKKSLRLVSVTTWALAGTLHVSAQIVWPTIGEIRRLDPELDQLLDSEVKIEVLASGFVWSEGPVWDRAKQRLLFSDVPKNHIHSWSEKEGLQIFMKPSGFTGPFGYGPEPGSNGLAFDQQGQLLTCEHGDRRVSVLTSGGGKMTLADSYQGKRFNSPNDLVVHPAGSIFFTDPPYGLPKKAADPNRELDYFGVYRIDSDRTVTLLIKNLTRPNGIALSPDAKTLYVAQSDSKRPLIFSYPVHSDQSVGEESVFFDASELAKKYRGMPDGLKVDQQGNVWATGPGGVLIINSDGRLLGHIVTTKLTANCGWGDDGSTLYLTADAHLMRVKTRVKGLGW